MRKLLLLLFVFLTINFTYGQNLSEGFEGTTFPPAGWSVINLGDANTWVRSTSYPRTGLASASITYGATAHNDYLITPQLAPVAGNSSISFWARSYLGSSYPEQFDVLLSTTGNAAANFTVTLASAVTAPDPYGQFTYSLAAYVGQNVYVAIRAISTDQYYLLIDDVAGPPLTPTPAPTAQPTALNLTPGVSTVNGTFTAAAPAPNGGYLVVRSTASSLSANPANGTTYTAGAALGGGVVVSSSNLTSFLASGLNGSTQYYFFLFSYNIGGTGPAYMTSGPLTGNTTTLAPVPICGTKTVGAGGDYVNLTAAMTALGNSIMTCPVTLLLRSDYTSAGETFPIIVPVILGSSSTNTLTIKPNTGVTATVSGASAAGPIFRIFNSNTIIDGSNTAGGTTRNLTITNTSTTTPQVVFIASTSTTPITNVTVKNSTLINGVNSSSALIVEDVTGVAGYFNNIYILNNSLQKAYIAIYCLAVVSPGNGNGLFIDGNNLNTSGANAIRLVAVYAQGVNGATISNNTIGNMANTTDASNITGIWLATGTTNTTISGNTISGISGTASAPRAMAISSGVNAANLMVAGNTINNISTTSTGNAMGIYFFSTTSGITISKNLISNIKNTNAGGYMATGMYLNSTAAGGANCTVVNNAIWDIAGYGYSSYVWNGMGILVYGGFGYNIYFNTVYMNTEQTLATGMPSAMFIYSSVTAAGAIDLRNNIFSTSQMIGTNRYAIYSQAANTVFSNIDYNDYYTTGPNLGYIGATNRATLADIQTGFGGNLNSQALNPTFVGTDLHPTNAALGNKGLFMVPVTMDITGAYRPDPADMGAYQFTSNQAVTTVSSANLTTTSATLNGSITAANRSVTSGFEYGLSPTYGTTVAATPAIVTGNTATPVSVDITGLAVNQTYHYRAIGTSGSLVVIGADMTFSTAVAPAINTTAASPVGATFATLNGNVNPKNATTTVSFEYGLTTGYGQVANVAGTYTGNTVQNFNASVSGLTINTWYHYRAKAVNPVTGSPFYGADQMFFTTCVVPPAPGTITGPATVCKGVTTNTYSVAQVPYGFYYNWTFPTGFVITTYEHSNVVTVTVLNTAVSGTVSVIAVSDCGAPSIPSTKAVVVNDVPVPTVAGNASVCQYVNNTYTTQAGNSAYVWSVSPDGTITPTSNPDIVTINWAASGAKTVGVVYTNPTTGCTAPTPGTKPVTVNAAPVPVIAGPTNMCVNSGYFNYTTETGKSNYTWTVSSGGTITGGQGTANLEVFWNTPGAQVVTVNYSDGSGCYANTPSSYNVTVDGLPGASGSITGSADVCLSSTGSYTVPAIVNTVYYVWSLPAGATIIAGEGTNNITVGFAANAVSGNVTVYGNSLCGNGTISPSFPIVVHSTPAAAGTVTGPSAVCEGSTGIEFSVPPVTEASGYKWNVPYGATIVFGDNTPNIVVDFAVGADTGVVNVYGTNLCGNGVVSADLHVTVFPIPETPVITLNGDILSSNIAEGNQWYYNGALIYGATGQTQLAQYSGWYWDVVTSHDCSSDTSNNIYVTITGIEDPQASNFVISPVPNNGSFQATINSPVEQNFNIMVYNQLGEMIYESKDNKVKGVFEKNIDLRPVPSGIYSVIFQSADKRVTKKIIINK